MSTKLKTSPNPDSRKHWLIGVEIKDPCHIRVRIVPDKIVADHHSLTSHIQEVASQSWSTPEEMILKVIESINNELIPMWLDVFYEKDGISICLEDQQPGLVNFKPPEK